MSKKRRLNVVALGLALAVCWAIGTAALGLAGWLFDWGTDIVKLVSSLYIGYDTTPLGVLIGAGWAFGDGLIGGLLVGLLYNAFQRTKE